MQRSLLAPAPVPATLTASHLHRYGITRDPAAPLPGGPSPHSKCWSAARQAREHPPHPLQLRGPRLPSLPGDQPVFKGHRDQGSARMGPSQAALLKPGGARAPRAPVAAGPGPPHFTARCSGEAGQYFPQQSNPGAHSSRLAAACMFLAAVKPPRETSKESALTKTE